MGAIASQITSLTIVYSTVYSDADQRKHQSPASLAFVRGIHRSPVNSPHKWPVTRKIFPFDDIMWYVPMTGYRADFEAKKTLYTVYPKKYAHGFCFAVLCCGYTLTDFPISIRLTSLALWQSNDCPSASKATLMNMDKYFMWIHYERLQNHNKAKHNKTMCIFLGIYCTSSSRASFEVSFVNIFEKNSCAIERFDWYRLRCTKLVRFIE